MIPLLLAVAAGLLVGVVIGRVRVPRTDWVSFLSLALLIVGLWWALIVSVGVSLGDALVFVVVSQISAGLYAAWLWQRRGVVAPSYLRLVWWSLWRPGYVAELDAAANAEARSQAADASASSG